MPSPPHTRLLPIAFCCFALAWGFFELADARSSSAELDLDHQVVRMLRQPDDSSRMIGPPQLEEAMRDFTALGGYAILLTSVVCFAIFALIELGLATFHFFWLTTVGGFLVSVLVKQLVHRERPSIVPHLSHVSGSTSFPSSHAMMSVVVYLTIGFLLSQLTSSRHLRHLFVGLPMIVAILVGISRVCMGVHFPTDVLGGWTGGLFWTWCAFLLRGRLSGNGTESPEKELARNTSP